MTAEQPLEEKGRPIVNRVANSGLVTIDLEKYFDRSPRAVIDLKEILWQGLILREKDLRDFIKKHDWSYYKDKSVAVTCSADAVIPVWAYMLIAAQLQPFVHFFLIGTKERLEETLFRRALNNIDVEKYKNAKVVVKGCGEVPVPASAYAELTGLLRPVAASIMYGEPCSTVPIYKKPKTN